MLGLPCWGPHSATPWAGAKAWGQASPAPAQHPGPLPGSCCACTRRSARMAPSGASVGKKRRGRSTHRGALPPPAPRPPPARSYATICVNKSRTLSRDSTAGPGGSRKTRAPFTGRRLLTVAPGVPGHPQEPRKAALRTERWAPRAERGSVVSEAASVPARRPPGRAHGASAAFAADPRAARLRK